jgi:hypothetical protein
MAQSLSRAVRLQSVMAGIALAAPYRRSARAWQTHNGRISSPSAEDYLASLRRNADRVLHEVAQMSSGMLSEVA